MSDLASVLAVLLGNSQEQGKSKAPTKPGTKLQPAPPVRTERPDAMRNLKGVQADPGPKQPTFNVPGQNAIQNIALGISEGMTFKPADFGTPSEFWDPKALGLLAGVAGVLEPGPDLGPLFSGAKKVVSKFVSKRQLEAIKDLTALGFDTSKRWFHGTPKVYKGMPDPYVSEFGLFGGGAYFTEAPEVASGYAGKPTKLWDSGDTKFGFQHNPLEHAPNIKPAFLSVKNPIDMDILGDAEEWADGISSQFGEDITAEDLLSVIEFDSEMGPTNEDLFNAASFIVGEDFGIPILESTEIMKGVMEHMGHDGITHMGGGRVRRGSTPHRVMIAFHPEQIASPFQSADEAIESVLRQPPSANPTSRIDR